MVITQNLQGFTNLFRIHNIITYLRINVLIAAYITDSISLSGIGEFKYGLNIYFN